VNGVRQTGFALICRLQSGSKTISLSRFQNRRNNRQAGFGGDMRNSPHKNNALFLFSIKNDKRSGCKKNVDKLPEIDFNLCQAKK
jgi:hypothetical protein